MVAIPKTKVSTIKNKEKHDLSGTYSGTTNFGVVFPSFAREMMPKAKFKMSVTSKILNAPMPVPTFGDMFLNHKHVYVPYVDICPQYDSFLSAQSYTIPGGTSYVPTELPYLDLPLIAQWCLSYFADFTVYKCEKQLNSPTYDEPTKWKPLLFERGYNQEDLDIMKDVFIKLWKPQSGNCYFYGKSLPVNGGSPAQMRASANATFADAFKMMPLAPILRDGFSRSRTSLCGRWLAGQFSFNGDRTMLLLSDFWKFNGNVVIPDVDISSGGMWQASEGYVDITTADYVSLFGPVNSPSEEYAIAFKLRSTAKHFFNILVGLGYQFTPNLEDQIEPQNWLKLLAFYKSWFNIFRPKRQLSFTQTNCYKLIKLMELQDANSTIYPADYDLESTVKEFLWDLATDPYYYLPQDYFGMSTLTPNADYTEDGMQRIPAYIGVNAPTITSSNGVTLGNTGIPDTPTVFSGGDIAPYSPAIMKMAMGILKHVNKNTVIGKSVADYIKVHFGVSLDSSHDLDKVYVIGDVSEDIDISPVMSMAQTDGDDLGAYAGRGYGESSKGNEFEFENTTNTHGVWITLSCVIPKSGYYQGVLRENRSLKRFDFEQSDLDALGYEVLSRSEVSADYPVCTDRFNPHTYTDFDRKKGFGFVPRQSFIKVGRDIVAGEMALRSGKSQFSGYHLNRVIPYENVMYSSLYDAQGNAQILTEFYAPKYIPNVVHDEFRRIDPTDRLGNYNRVFYSESVNDDHFIVGFKFKVEAWMPLLSLSDSFDTEQADTKDINIEHS